MEGINRQWLNLLCCSNGEWGWRVIQPYKQQTPTENTRFYVFLNLCLQVKRLSLNLQEQYLRQSRVNKQLKQSHSSSQICANAREEIKKNNTLLCSV